MDRHREPQNIPVPSGFSAAGQKSITEEKEMSGPGEFFCSEMQISGFVQLPGQNETFQRLLCAQCSGSGVAVPGEGDPSGSLWKGSKGRSREGVRARGSALLSSTARVGICCFADSILL